MATFYVADGYVDEGYIQTGVTVLWGPKIIFVPKIAMVQLQSTPTEIWQLDIPTFKATLGDLLDNTDGMSYPDIFNHNPSVTVGGAILAKVVEILEPYTITFEDGQYAVNLTGANSNIGDRVNVNQVSIRSANSAGLQDLTSLQAASFGEGAVTLDITNGTAGTTYPIGTKGKPSNNIADAITIAQQQNMDTIFVIGYARFGAGDVLDGYTIKGQNPTKAYIVIDEAASTVGCEFKLCTITGILDGGTVLRECLVLNISYVNGFLDECVLDEATIVLGGNTSALFMRCIGRQGTLTIDMGGAGQALNISDYQGRLKIINKTGTDDCTIHMSAGRVELDNTVTNGVIYLDGVGKPVYNVSNGAVVVNEMVNGAEIANIQRLVELQRPHHVATGNVWYWNPYSGSDLNEGDHISRPVATFAKAQELAKDGNHDVIIAVPGNPAGPTITTENITITKSYLFLRGPGRDFQIQSSNDNEDAIHITGNGVEVSGMVVSTSLTSTKQCIYTSGDFTLLKDLWLQDAVEGLHFEGGQYSIADNVKVHHNINYGIKFSGDATHVDIIDCHIGSNGGDGILIDTLGGHEVNIIGDTVIHKNAGYGINITSNSEGVIIAPTVSVFNNTLGEINDSGVSTFNGVAQHSADISDTVWSAPTRALTETVDSNVVSVTGTAVVNVDDFKATSTDLTTVLTAIESLNNITAADVRAAFNAIEFQDKNTEVEIHTWLDSYMNKDAWKAITDLTSVISKLNTLQTSVNNVPVDSATTLLGTVI